MNAKTTKIIITVDSERDKTLRKSINLFMKWGKSNADHTINFFKKELLEIKYKGEYTMYNIGYKSRLWKIIATALAVTMLLSFTVSAGSPEGANNDADQTLDKSFNSEIEKVISSKEMDSNNTKQNFRNNIFDSGKKQDIWGLLGAEVKNSDAATRQTKSILVVHNERTDQDYTRYELTNGGSIGINELGIVNINNYEMLQDIQHEKSLDAVIETITSDLALQNYKVTESGLYSEQGTYYRIVWQRKIDNIGTNPYDSVWVLLDSDTFQILYLDRYSMPANSTKAKLSEEDAFKIASKYFDNKDTPADIKLTYARPNTTIDGEQPTFLFEAKLAYIIKDGEKKVIVDALTGEIIGLASAAKSARAFGCTNTKLQYSSKKMALAKPKLASLGYTTSANYTLNTTTSNQDFINFLKGKNNYGLYITCHASSSVLTNNKTDDEDRYFRVESSSVPSGGIWNFVFLDACETATNETWSNAFNIKNSSTQRAFIGFDGPAYADDTYEFGKNFWSKVGKKTISECVAYGDSAPGCDDLYSVFRGDEDYNGKV